jgi:hypothetical protein
MLQPKNKIYCLKPNKYFKKIVKEIKLLKTINLIFEKYEMRAIKSI